MALRERIVARIRDSGPMPFDEYMEWCLYDPAEGFFSAGRGPGRERDFVTSPETSASFGELITRWAMERDHPPGTPFIEIGSGSGALLAAVAPAWHERGAVYAVERAPAARAALTERFPDVTVLAGLDELPVVEEAVVVGNEVLDNMPAALARRDAGRWVELAVDEVNGALDLVETPARPAVATWCDETYRDVPEGVVVAAQVEVSRWLTDILGRFGRLSMCLIDYAEPSEVLAARSPDDVIRAYRGHRAYHGVLEEPGATDLTVDVNVDAVVAACHRSGATIQVVDQRSFLIGLGARDEIDVLDRTAAAAARDGRTMDQLAARSRRLDLEAVLDPRGFGGFRVLTISSGTAA